MAAARLLALVAALVSRLIRLPQQPPKVSVEVDSTLEFDAAGDSGKLKVKTPFVEPTGTTLITFARRTAPHSLGRRSQLAAVFLMSLPKAGLFESKQLTAARAGLQLHLLMRRRTSSRTGIKPPLRLTTSSRTSRPFQRLRPGPGQRHAKRR